MIAAPHVDFGQAILHILVAAGLSYVIGFERAVRGSPAGDRTFSTIGIATGILGELSALTNSPTILAGAVTGVGFLCTALAWRRQGGAMVSGMTSAATIIAVAAIGAMAGFGYLLLSTCISAILVLVLELEHLPVFRAIDARYWFHKFDDDTPPSAGRGRHELHSS